MKELINWYYQLQIDHLEQINHTYYTKIGNRFIYIIPVGKDKNTVFFHLLQLLQYSQNQRIVLSKDNTTTVLFNETHYYVLESSENLHEKINITTLQIPSIYPQPYPVATHLKERWIAKNQFHEEQLQVLIDKLSSDERLLFFDLATYYIHLNEQAYTFINDLSDVSYPVSLCHMRLTAETYKFECFSPEILTLDNRVRCYCEYIRDLFLNVRHPHMVHDFVLMLHRYHHLTEQEWQLLYARLYFPTQFYDALHSLREGEPLDVSKLYEQALFYSELLYQFGNDVQAITGITIRIPEWVVEEAKTS